MIDTSSLAKLQRALEGERGHGFVVKGVRRLKMQKVMPLEIVSGQAPVRGKISLEVDGLVTHFEFEADDLFLVSREGTPIA